MPPAAPQKIILDEYGSDIQGNKARIHMTGNPGRCCGNYSSAHLFRYVYCRRKRQIASEDARFRMYNPGEMLIRQGSSDQSLFIILSGTVAVTGSAGGTVLAVLRAGDIFGEMALSDRHQENRQRRCQGCCDCVEAG